MAAYREHLASEAEWKKAKIAGAKSRCLKAGLPFDLTVEGLFWPTHCPVFGFELTYSAGNHFTKQSGASLDRIDPNGGYTLDNVQVISFRANLIKNDMTDDEQKLFADWVQKKF